MELYCFLWYRAYMIRGKLCTRRCLVELYCFLWYRAYMIRGKLCVKKCLVDYGLIRDQ